MFKKHKLIIKKNEFFLYNLNKIDYKIKNNFFNDNKNVKYIKIIFRGLNFFLSFKDQNNEIYIIEIPNFINLHDNLNYIYKNKIFKKNWYSNKYYNFDDIEKINPQIIDLQILNPSKKNIIVNTLDEYYGHSIYKIINSIDLLENSDDYNLIIVCQKKLKWMFENANICKFIIFPNKANISKYLINLDKILNNIISQNNNFYYTIFKPHPFKNFDSDYLINRSPFNLKNFDKKPYNITFVYRSDRLWHSNLLERKIFHFSLRYNIKPLGSLIAFFNNLKIKKLYDELKKTLGEDYNFNIIGDGNRFFKKKIKDNRKNNFSKKYDLEYFKILSESHVSIGIQGSNMIFASYLSGGFIEIIPDYDEENYLNDIILNKKNNYNTLYFSRFTYEFPTYKYISKLTANMILKYKHYKDVGIIK